ncbi:MAG TPA: PEP-CTERM sorting domain-containing protein [Aquabacterium sp.]|uniref:PEP-CTERM sorting domain-containing protein n=1 Tax=Aquabacterium sp. TaxID=1872578 RepID=UPI002E34CB9A|nr:PEP-CTERM sorting domain-containing protein [Aquabacterium sp.]HEX5357415.1 PEP-CTERM sorting domain-containing protein [Aquabacterium sp.]
MARFQLNWALSAALLACVAAPATAGVFGTLGNFDVVNDTGSTAYGFEIDLEGLHSSDITDTFGGAGRGFPTSVERYGAPSISEYANGSIFGVKVTYQALYSNGSWSVGTPSGVFTTPGESCWTGGNIGYGASTPCDHFGVGTIGNPTKTTYSWLVESGSPGVLTNAAVNLPAPVWSVTPSPNPAAPAPVVVAQIQAPKPEIESQFGTAIWVKVYTTELENKVELEELVGGDPKVLAAKGHTEIEWQLLQTDPGNPLAGQLENGGGAAVGEKAESVLRRYEFFNYIGAYDQETNEALPVLGDSHPGDGELGDFIGAQNVAVNLNGNPVGAVPEPATNALMLGGLAMVLLVLRRRQGQRQA